MALDSSLAIDTSQLIFGILILVVGCLLYGFSNRFPPGVKLLGVVVGIIMGIVGIIFIVMSFL